MNKIKDYFHNKKLQKIEIAARKNFERTGPGMARLLGEKYKPMTDERWRYLWDTTLKSHEEDKMREGRYRTRKNISSAWKTIRWILVFISGILSTVIAQWIINKLELS